MNPPGLSRLLLPLLLCAVLAPAAGQAPPSGVTLVRVEEGTELTKAQREAALGDLAKQERDPQHVVVLIHGWDTPVFQSAKEYAAVAPVIRKEFARNGERVAVVGLQWDSDAGPKREWVPQVFFHHAFRLIGFKKAVKDPYLSRVPVARALGRQALRQLLLGIEDRYPSAHLHLFAHSMGSEMAVHAVDPGFSPFQTKDEPQTYEPGRLLKLDILALLGADVDYDAEAKAPAGSKERGALPSVLWITLPKLGEVKDKALSYRKKARGKAALGNSVPQLRGEQIDAMVTKRCLIFDTIEIPPDHVFVKYFSQGRVARLADAAATLRDPSKQASVLLKHMEEVLQAPNDVKALAPHLMGEETTPKVYALWRLERLLCGGVQHLESGYATEVLDHTIKDPFWLDEERKQTACKVVGQGLWPPADVVARVRALAAQKRAARQQEPTNPFFTQPSPSGLGVQQAP
jgi:hypothetical protein